VREGVTDVPPKPVSGAGALGLVVTPMGAGGLVPKRGPDMNLESGADGASAVGSGFGMRPNVPGSIPLNRLGTDIVAGFVASSGFGAPPSVNSLKLSVGTGTLVTAGIAKEDEGLSLGAVPFAASRGGVIGLGIKDGAGALTACSTKGSTLAGGGVNLISAGDGEGALGLVSHCPNGVLGDAGRGLSEEGFSPLTSSSSPPDTGAFARGELRTGRVLGLPRLVLDAGDGVSDGEGSVGIGCCNDDGSLDGDPGGVVLRKREVDDS